ncbi:MAG: methylated-DNA--[protein]-cysteine S-methyltransferase [Flavobacteriaceae bacterium]|jgi:AraC family transcriptional regulator of adaptative response/methylated-DNA-[protein]-cysteine methyltransferase|nr:methylated-DNA--[protein]-cysteine S-methyltransferase [Flavobacteriaceae bacterium]
MEINKQYETAEKAIAYLVAHHYKQPNLAEIATAVGLSEFHFQRLFSEWVGSSPKQFLKYITLNYAKYVMKEKIANTLFDVADEVGLSSSSRLHDLFVSIEGMTPAEYHCGGEALTIAYSYWDTLFGKVVVASTDKGVCHVAFVVGDSDGLERVHYDFRNATLIEEKREIHQKVSEVFNRQGDLSEIKLHLKGTPFQLKVWEALLKIPEGRLTTYGQLAVQLDNAGASRAVGTAIGRNPVAVLIPCHRVIQQTGLLGGYMWGPERKQLIVGWELTKTVEE